MKTGERMTTKGAVMALALVTGLSAVVVPPADVAVAQADVVYAADFESVSPGDQPVGWVDTAAGNSMSTDDSLFTVSSTAGSNSLTTTSGASNIHSHVTAADASSFATATGYTYTGRMMAERADAGVGVTFFSDYPTSDAYYRLRRYGNGGSFRLSPHGTSITGGTIDSGVVPTPGDWYRFEIRVVDDGTATAIRAKVWAEGAAMPADWQIDAADTSATRRTSGTIGAWSHLAGAKHWDDLAVSDLVAPAEYAVTLSTVGAGSAGVEPDLATHPAGSTVEISATPDAGWVFVGWSGDHSGTDNPSAITVTNDVDVTAEFAEIQPVTLDLRVSGDGVVTADPDQAQHDLGSTVTLAATADPGHRFVGWSGDLTGAENPTSIVMNGDMSVVANFAVETTGLLDENFDAYAPGADPVDWFDTSANNSMANDESVFAVADVAGETAFATSGSRSNVHSHFVGADAATAADYEYRGRMYVSDATSGVGVTVLSDYPTSDTYYRLRRYGNGGSFRLDPHGAAMTGGTTDSGVVPVAGAWYRFAVSATDTGTRTEVRAKVWQDGTAEPADWQIDAVDDSADRLTSGTVGIWSWGPGTKAWDDLVVGADVAAEPLVLTTAVDGSGSIVSDPARAEYSFGENVALTAQPEAGWTFTGWSGDATGTENPTTVTMSGDLSVTATFSPAATYTLTTTTVGSGVVTADPDAAAYDDGTVVTVNAQPAAGWVFAGWSGDLGGGEQSGVVTMTADRAVTATFVEDVALTLDVATSGQGSTAVSPDRTTFSRDDRVTVTATPAPGWRFVEWQTEPAVGDGWWNQQWSYRLPVTIDAAGTSRRDVVADVGVDFTAAWSALGVTGEFDPDSLRVVEVDSTGEAIDTDVAFQFAPAPDYDAQNSANGTLSLLVAGTTPPAGERTYHVYFDDASRNIPAATVQPRITVTDGVADGELTTVRVETPAADYYYDKNGGGFSSIVDDDGADWIGWNSTLGSAGTYRGIPNLVYPENGMHPGKPGVVTTIVDQGPLKVTLRSETLDGRWATLWEIGPSSARMTVLRAGHDYWFLYEGTPGGSLDLASDVVVRSDGTQTSAGQSWTGDLAGEEWVYFGDPASGPNGRSLFIANHDEDDAVDSYYPMQGNMTVFGFGRSGTGTFLSTVPKTFTLGLTDGIDQGSVAGRLRGEYHDLDTTVTGAESRGSAIGDPTLVFDITADTSVTAVFAEIVPVTLDVVANGAGTVSVEPDQATYQPGDTVTITATPDAGSYFTGWSGDRTGSANPLSVTLAGDTAITADFAVDGGLTVDTTVNGSGTIALDPQQDTYSFGQTVTVTAIADAGSVFQGWGGDLAGTANPRTITIDGDNALSATFGPADPGAPVIDVWYGADQEFGHIGRPQRWQNVLGNVSDPDGVTSLSYTLNGGAARNLSIGPDSRRLFRPGDFNVDLDDNDLVEGDNTVVITAVDSTSAVSTRTVIVDYESGNVWPQTQIVDWDQANVIHDVAQPVDGQWELEGDGVRSVDPAYDRLIGIGDVQWSDYEVTFPVTVNAVDNAGFSSGTSGRGAGLGVLFRWNGHTDFPVVYPQPKTGYLPYGAIGWYWYNSPSSARLRIDGNNQVVLDQSSNTTPPTVGVEYIMKMRVTTEPGVGGLYQLKSWPSGQPEPAAWQVSGQESMSDPQTGSILLLAHHVDATFGDVVITPVGESVGAIDTDVVGDGTVTVDPDRAEYGYGEQVTVTATADPGWEFVGWQGDLSGSQNPATINLTGAKNVTAVFADASAPPEISDVEVTTFTDSAVVTWTTDRISDSRVDYGPTVAHGSTATGPAGVTDHSVTLTGLSDATTYHFRVSSASATGGTATSADATFTTLDGDNPSGIVSDDFNVCSIDTGRWTLVDPIGDGSASVDGTRLALGVPNGVAHDVWSGGNNSVRLMQAVNDHDFEIEVKFESPVTNTYQLQGLIVQQDAANFLRLDFYGNNGQTYLYAAKFVNGTPTVLANVPVTLTGSTSHMRLGRTGDDWVQSWSTDGVSWNTNASFSHPMVVSQAGVFAGNAGGRAPAHTALVDYVFNTTSPIVPEDSTTPECGGGGGGVGVGGGGADTTPPVISSVDASTTETTAQVTWTTDEASDSVVRFGPTATYGSEVSGSTSTTDHSVILTGLEPGTTYHYAVSSTDSSANTATSVDSTFTTPPATSGPQRLVSDDFTACAVDTAVWTVVDPIGDGTVSVNGSQLELSVPGGVGHDVWTGGNNSLRLMQTVDDTDLGVVTKYDSAVGTSYQMQGIIVGQDARNYLRFDLYGHNGKTYAFAARFTNGSPTVVANVAVPAGAPTQMRITRIGDTWTQAWSADGSTWTTTASFSHALTVEQVGPFAGNAGGAAPAHVAVIDYFLDTSDASDPQAGISCP